MVRFIFCLKTNIAKLNAFVLCCPVPRHVIGTQKMHFLTFALIFHNAASRENITPFLRMVRVSIMSRSLPSPPLRSPPTNPQNNSSMRLPVWRFGWGRNTVQECYGTVLHRTSTCGDNCWIEHGIQVVCWSIMNERGGWGRSYRYRLLWSKTEK